jgi:hypothetical protein
MHHRLLLIAAFVFTYPVVVSCIKNVYSMPYVTMV